MMKKLSLYLVMVMVFSFAVNAQKKNDDFDKKAKKFGIQTKDLQTKITTQQALQKLKEGNERFVAGKSVNQKNYRKQAVLTARGQYPFAAILSCVDSRVTVEDIFDLNNGDAFSGRIAGNVVNDDMLGSFEFATKLAGAKVLLVLGHTSCGAVKGACDDAKLGNLTGLLDHIEPAVEKVEKSWTDGATNSKNPAFVEAVSEENVRLTMEKVKKDSPIIKEMVENGTVLLVGGIYNLETGKVTFFE